MKIIFNIIKIIIIIIVVAWIGLFITDYLRAQKSEKPLFCLNEQNAEINGGTYYSCTSFGYKFYKYENPDAESKIGFGPAFVENEYEKEMNKQ